MLEYHKSKIAINYQTLKKAHIKGYENGYVKNFVFPISWKLSVIFNVLPENTASKWKSAYKQIKIFWKHII